MNSWTVTHGDDTTIITAPTYTAARAIARARACHGRQPYKTRAAALAAGDGPAYPCAEHWHATPAGEQLPPPAVGTDRELDVNAR